jgi:hypothetical protein
MADPENRLSPRHPDTAKAGRSPKKPTPLGTDFALNAPAASGGPLPLTYWDVWFALVATRDCGGDLGRLAERLGEGRTALAFGRESVERKQSHVRDLQKRLAAAGVTVADVLTASGDLARTELRRARKRVLEPTEREREWSAAMRQTPRKRRYAESLRGAWPRFPVSPEPYAAEIWSRFKTTGFYGENASFGVARKLDRFLERAAKLSAARRYAEAQALLRAWLTVVIELMQMADDSYGCIGDSFRQAFVTYLEIPLRETGIDEAAFFADLLGLLIWEDYGLTWRRTEGYFRGLTPFQADWCIAYLRRQAEELRADDLVYQSEHALTLLGQVVAEQERFDQFEGLAREMGAREWERIIRLADRAVKNRKRTLACQVFEAALSSGPHLDFLRKKYEQLQHGKWNPDPPQVARTGAGALRRP